MSHPHSPRVSSDSAAASALSHAANEQAHPSSASTGPAATAGTQRPGSAATAGLAPLAAQAQRWLQSRLPASLPAVPEPLKRFGTQTSTQWQRLSTTQKVLGGAILAGAGWYLLRRPGGKAAAHRRANPVGTLHELLLFVNDRIEGYRRAASESRDADLRNYYQELAGQSQRFANRLNGYLGVQRNDQETGTTLKGKLYRAWMEAKAAVTGYSETAVLGSNIYGEEWALKAYEEALQDRAVAGSLRREVQRQYRQSQQTHRRLQQLQAQY